MRRILACLTLLCAALAAQDKPANPLSAETRQMWDSLKGNILKSAEKMPEDQFAFKPVPEVRTFAGMLGHIADANYSFCSAALAETRPEIKVEKTKATKAEIVPALQESVAYCDKAYAMLTDANGSEIVKFFGRERSRSGVLNFNNAHDFEHYGNLVTYLRIKGIVPPSSEPRR